MLAFTPLPSWDGIHPAMVQFSIVLLLVAPLLVLVSLFSKARWRTWAGAALLVMGLGSFAAWLAVASGHAAGQLVDKTPALAQSIANHEALGVQMRNLFTLLALLFALLLLLPAMIRKALPTAARVGLYALFLAVYLGGTLVIVNTASQGGRLVHEMGVKALVAATNEPQAPSPPSESKASTVASSSNPTSQPSTPGQPAEQPARAPGH